MTFDRRAHGCYLRGRLDTVQASDDGSCALVDYKPSRPSPYRTIFYSRQLHTYAFALEHPAPSKLAPTLVTRLGLLVLEPPVLERVGAQRLGYLGEVTWLEVAKDYHGFLTFLDEVLDVLEQPLPPADKLDCPRCAYRDAARESEW